MIGKISLCLAQGSQVLVGMVGPAVLAKLSLSQSQREQIPKGNLTGAGPAIVKPIKPEISAWGDFLNICLLHYLFISLQTLAQTLEQVLLVHRGQRSWAGGDLDSQKFYLLW